ncbi:MAG: hydantoin utilization protein [Rhodospirillales bacterium]|nr:hydantoin utilization protein [Rhodospirillales bacterium]
MVGSAAQRTAGPRIDPVTASVIQGALENIAVEMGFKLMRMSYSSIIRESEDFGAAICDSVGRQLCECSKSTPLQSGPIPGYVKGIQKLFEERGHRFAPGDVIIHNDPYRGASHSPDVGFCMPIFDGETLIGFSMTTAHHLDLGSAQPGSMGLVECVDRYAEGVIFRALKIVDAGKLNDVAWQMITDNVRMSDLVLGDMEAQIAACRVGANRFLELYRSYGAETLWGAVEDLLDYSERLMRSQIAKVPDGVYRATGHIDGFLDSADPALSMLPIEVAVTVRGDDIAVDFTGTAPQLEHHAINMPFVGTVDVAVRLMLRTILLDSAEFLNVPQNDGLFRPITITAPRGTLVNPIEPAPTIARATGGNRVADTVMRALAPAVPQSVSAGTGSLRGVAFSGFLEGQQWVHLEIFEGAYGGRYGKDGMDSVDTLYANTRNNPIEDIESHVPLRVVRYEFRDHAVAAGRWRGGVNSVKEIEFLCDGSVSAESDNHKVAAWGFDGGAEGYNSELILATADGQRIQLPSMLPTIQVSRGDRLVCIGGTGGGYGSPKSRDPQQVYQDVCDDLITVEQAAQDYAVVIGDQGVDLERTRLFRNAPPARGE